MESTDKTIADLVTADFRAAFVFRAFGIDYCCDGSKTISEYCTDNDLSSKEIYDSLSEAYTRPLEQNFDFKFWPLNLLATYIETKFHKLAKKQVPLIKAALERGIRRHGKGFLQLHEISLIFDQAAEELAQHLKREELILFPYIKKVFKNNETRQLMLSKDFSKIQRDIENLMLDHEQEGEYLTQIRSITDNYSLPEDSPKSIQLIYSLLEEFDLSMQKHMHLERNILFEETLNLLYPENEISIESR
ncbi:DUF542 domain-containing protein [Algoriphagus hitonicola]|uniref:Regulator of cell morphogenesis and NO signaling n=1 Tax=Algoriphagus hitonicola TaxID=435880 RepID=A0A1I2VLY5_9BACT|nr:DUF542 domain-containing protein [Algoriphagus hitonicola]SFG90298.1 regulator of cell morphogenesis and NO signaling [Algoriphagus hitonicola]